MCARRNLRFGEVTLARALSKLGLASRSEASAWIESGRVAVDGAVVHDPHATVIPERTAITVDDAIVRRADFRCLLLNKPRGYVTTRVDPQGRPTVFALVADAGVHLVAVGRLDLATSGLLLLTNDTRLADRLTDPANAVPRVYLVTVRGRWDEGKSWLVKEGVVAGSDLLRAAEVVARKISGRESHLVVTLVEGKNREVRRLMKAAGHEVTSLKRVAFGGLELGGLPSGRWREIPFTELSTAFGEVVRGSGPTPVSTPCYAPPPEE